MDELRQTLQAQRSKTVLLKRPVVVALVVLAAVIAYALMSKSSTSVDRDSLGFAKVEEITGRRIAYVSGKIFAENPRIVSAEVSGRVDRVVLLSGARAKEGDLVLELVNRAVVDSELAASAELAAGVLQAEKTMAEMQIQVIEKQGVVSDLQAHAEIARRQEEAERKLADDRIISEIQANKSKLEADSSTRKAIEAAQLLKILESMLKNVRMAGEAQIERQQATAALRKAEVDSLKVRSPINGVVQEIAVTQGQEVATGTLLAKMYDPALLSVVLDVPERQAGNIGLGQPVSVSIGGEKVSGKVIRVSPVVKDGVVAVEVKIEGKMPQNTRPELRVEAEIFSRTLEKTTVLRAPEAVRSASVSRVFVVDGDRAYAKRVRFGQLQGNQIEVLDGLRPGDVVVVTGLGEHADYEEIDLK